MVGCSRRKRAVVDAAVERGQIITDNDPIQLRHRLAGMKTASRRKHGKAVAKLFEHTSAQRPLIKVAHQYRRASRRAFGQFRQYGPQLLAAADARDVKVHPDDAQALAVDQHIRAHRI